MSAILLDTETTGLDQPRILEAAWLIFTSPGDLTPQQQFWQRYHPAKPIEPAALAIHHIREQDMADCLPYSDFQLPTGVPYLVGYNIDYDWRLIGQPPLRRICAMALARLCFPGLDRYSQSAVLHHVVPDRARGLLRHAHSALQDAQNCRLILQAHPPPLAATAFGNMVGTLETERAGSYPHRHAIRQAQGDAHPGRAWPLPAVASGPAGSRSVSH
jgi:exodeoxyribonuclease X